MSNYIVIEIAVDAASNSLADLNGRMNMSTKAFESVQGVKNLLAGLEAGAKTGSVKIVTKDAATTINTSGTNSASNTFSF